jgi:hypothetical protein
MYVKSRRVPAFSAGLHGCLVPVERVSLEVLTVQSSRTIEHEATHDDRIVRCDEEIEMNVILLILFIAVLLAVHAGMLHRFGSPYR